MEYEHHWPNERYYSNLFYVMSHRGECSTSSAPATGAVKALAHEYKSLVEEPVEGFQVKLSKDSNLFEWEVAIFGPPDTLYAGGYFKARMKFPVDYPYSPPTVRFLTKVWHPNVYESGDLCISILHPPVDDPQSGELPCERWNPTQTVRTILLSVVSLLNEPNTFSPANVDASVMYRKWRDTNGEDKEYEHIIRKQVENSRQEAERDGVRVPTTLEDYCVKTHTYKEETNVVDMSEFYYDVDGEDDTESTDDPDEDSQFSPETTPPHVTSKSDESSNHKEGSSQRRSSKEPSTHSEPSTHKEPSSQNVKP